MQSLQTLIENANSMKSLDYLDWCSTIEEIEGCGEFMEENQDEIFYVVDNNKTTSIKTRKQIAPNEEYHSILKLSSNSGFFPDEESIVRNGYCRAIQEPGAYIEIYDIIAVNTKTKNMWAIHHSMSQPFDFSYKPILPLETANLICLLSNIIINEKRDKHLYCPYCEFKMKGNKYYDDECNTNVCQKCSEPSFYDFTPLHI